MHSLSITVAERSLRVEIGECVAVLSFQHGQGEFLVYASGLTTDLLHPSDYGHIAIGEKLALLTAPQLGKITPPANP